MAYRLPGERIALDGEPTVTVEPIHSWTIRQLALGYCTAYEKATTPEALLAALNRLYDFLIDEAMPEWDIEDHRGRIPATTAGMHRLPVEMAGSIVWGWIATYKEAEEPAETAVDKMVPPSPLRDELNRRLRAARKAA